jgi:D-alanine--poly(phosphoribitol) ligase subunit 2
MHNSDCQRIQTELTGLLAEKLNVEVMSEDTDLFESGILDSQRFVELLLHIEQQFGTHTTIDDFEIENFRSISRIATLILKHKNAASHASDAAAETLHHR